MSKDLVFDIMHIMGLNLFKTYTKVFFEDVEKHERKNKIFDIVKSACKSVTQAYVAELKQIQWPYDPVTNHETYTAEKFQKLVQ